MKSPVTLLKVIVIALLTAREAQASAAWPVVTGYVGHAVTLPCQFIPGPKVNITQLQWELGPPEGIKIKVLVFSGTFGINISESFLKRRVALEGRSLVIQNVEMGDAGSYTCRVAAFPTGSFQGNTNLLVQEQMPLSSGLVAAIVIVVIVLLVIMAAIVYLIFIRRCDPTARQRVSIDTGGAAMFVARPSVLVRDEDVVYSDVTHKGSRDAAVSSNEKHTADDVTYSEVLIFHQQPTLDEIYV